MIGKHCGQYTQAAGETRQWFSRKCRVCGRLFAQRKRQQGASTKEQPRLWKEKP